MYLLTENSVEIACPVEAAYEYACNLERFGEWFPGVIAIESANALEHAAVGKTYLEMGKPQEALPHLQRAAALSPNDPIVQTNLGSAFAALGRSAEARTFLQRALALSPNYQPAVSQLQSLGR